MSYTTKKLDDSQIELQFTVTPADYQKDVEAAAVRLSERAGIKGFRPGKAPYSAVKQQVGELKILEEALERIVQHVFFEAIKAEKLQTLGMPQITIEKIAPGNDLVFKAVVALVPNVKLPNLETIKTDVKPVKVGDKEVAETLENLRKYQPKEIAKTGASTKADKLVIELNMFIDKIPVEGGQAKNHQVYLSEPHYIPGLAEQLVGLKAGEEKEFNLKFPSEHYQKHLAGKNVDFKVKVNEVFELQYADLNDDFAKKLGQESLEKLKQLLLANLTTEAEKKEDQRQEVAILEELIAKSEFDVIPKIVIDSEKKKMFYELKNDLDRRGIPMEQYLMDLKKTEDQIFNDFTEGATKRAKAALISREVAKQNKITVNDKEIAAEVEAIKKAYPNDAKVEENLTRHEVLDTIAATLQNRKVVEYLKSKIAPKS